MDLTAVAETHIPPPRNRRTIRKRRYRTGDIIDLVQEVIRTHRKDTAEFARMFTRDKAGLRQLFDFVDDNFTYVEDTPGAQLVQTPAYLWREKQGDCKSFTVFISSVLQNLGVPHYIRYVGYGTHQYRHVYPVALLNGRETPLDVVCKKQENGRFGAEKSYTVKKDFRVEGLYKLGNSRPDIASIDEAAIIGQLQTTLDQVTRATAEIPDSVMDGPDVTTMTAGELDRLIWSDRFDIYADQEAHGGRAGQYRDAAEALRNNDIAGIAGLKNDPLGRQVASILAATNQKTQPAFAPFRVEIPNPIPPHLRGFFSGIGKFIKKVGRAIGDAFKKFTNWIFKGMGQKMGPFFIFTLLAKKNHFKSPQINQRTREQAKTYDFIRRLGKFDDKQLQGIMLNGVKKYTGKSPQQIAKEGGVDAVCAGSAVIGTVIKAISFVVQVVKKIVGIFKKRADTGTIDETTMSDPTLFEEEARLRNPPPGAASGGFTPLTLAALAIPFILK
ncbi:MAG: hypothetical protein AAGA31_13205 [Bacteroidota bacterium]